MARVALAYDRHAFVQCSRRFLSLHLQMIQQKWKRKLLRSFARVLVCCILFKNVGSTLLPVWAFVGAQRVIININAQSVTYPGPQMFDFLWATLFLFGPPLLKSTKWLDIPKMGGHGPLLPVYAHALCKLCLNLCWYF